MRYQAYLRERYRLLLGYIGGLWIIIALTILSPLLLLPFYPEEVRHAPIFLMVGVPLGIAAFILRWRTRIADAPSPNVQEGMVAVLIAWVGAIIVGAIPLMLLADLNFTQAIFESTSGWTTTGLSVVDVEAVPRIVLFYRSTIQLVGGAGFAIIVLSSIVGPMGSGISRAEGRDDQLAPNVRQSAALVLRIYVTYIVLGTVALALAGMGLFDAINHAFAALSTGGFSTRAASIGYWDSPAIEAVILILMLLGTLNYLTAYVLLRGKFKAVSRNGEIRLMAVLLPAVSFLLLVGVGLAGYESLGKAVRVVIFEATSAISTTGFSTVSYTAWPGFGWMVLIIVMLIGGGSGSTAGGIKQLRVYVLLHSLYWEIRSAFISDRAVNRPVIWRGEQRDVLTDAQIRRTALFVFLYMMLYFGGVLIFVAHNIEIDAALFEVASVLSTVGLSVGVTAVDAPPTLLWAMSVGMLLGRLEFLALVIGVLKLVRDGYEMTRPTEAAA